MKNGNIRSYLFALFFCSFFSIQAQPGSWLLSGGSDLNESIDAITTDDAGNIYAAINFLDTLVFMGDTSIGTGLSDLLMVKISPAGNLIWSVHYPGGGGIWAYDMMIDPENRLNILGAYLDSAYVGPFNIKPLFPFTHAGLRLRLDTAGNYIGYYDTRGPGGEFIYGGTHDGTNMYFTGKYRDYGRLDWDTLSNYGLEDLWVFKTQLSDTGDYLWWRKIGGKQLDAGLDVAFGDDSLVTVCGYCTDTTVITEDSANIEIGVGKRDILVAQYNDDGDYRWHIVGGSTGEDRAEAVVADASGNVYVCGTFDSTITIGSHTVTTQGGLDMFLMKIDRSGSIQWFNTYGDVGFDALTDIDINSNGEIVGVGYFQGQLILGDTLNTSDTTDSDAFIALFDANGNPQWARKGGSSTLDQGSRIAVDPNDDIVFGGLFNSTFHLHQLSVTTTGGDDFFIARALSTGQVSRTKNFGFADTKLELFPNPTQNVTTIRADVLDGFASIDIVDVQGRVVKKMETNSMQLREGVELDCSDFRGGVYLVVVSAGEQKATSRLMIQ